MALRGANASISRAAARDVSGSAFFAPHKITSPLAALWEEALAHTVPSGRRALALDATAGRGRDALQLAQLCSRLRLPGARLLALDSSDIAISSTRSLLANAKHRTDENDNAFWPRVDVLHCDHAHLESCLHTEDVLAVAAFNLGYLPQLNPGTERDATLTQPETTATALRASLRRLHSNGLLTVAVYLGHGAYDELDAVRCILNELNPREFTTMELSFANRAKAPILIYTVRH
jgi:hypothetical protein